MGKLARIGELERELEIEIIIEKEKGHYEWRKLDNTRGYESQFSGEEVLVVDSLAKTKPDVDKVQNAVEELVEIYKNSKWYHFFVKRSVRRVLGVSEYTTQSWDDSVGGTNGQYEDYGKIVKNTLTGEVVCSEIHRGNCDNR